MSTISISYTRFSHSNQGDGDSEKRQAEMFAHFCDRHQLRPAAKKYIDRGLSGYSGKHRSKGELGQLEELAKRHAFPRGTVLVVEAWDRLGRLRPDKQIELISGLVRSGLRIGVCRLDDIFAESDFGTHKWDTLCIFCRLAYEESRQKSERLTHSWKSRRERARTTGEMVTTQVPGWLEVVNGKMVPIPERVVVVKRIFELAGAGSGAKRIAGKLTEEMVPTFGRAKWWSKEYIRQILINRQALGEYQPEKYEEQPDGSRKEVPDGPPIKGYFPAVITQAEHDLARLNAGVQKGGKRTRQRRHINLFQGLVWNALLEGDSLQLANRRTAADPLLVLISNSGYNGGHPQVTFSYEVFTKAVLRLLREVPVSVVAPTEPMPVVEVWQARHDAIVADIEDLKADLRKKYSPTLSGLVVEKELELSTVKDELDRARAEAAHPLADTWAEAGDLMEVLKTDEDRLRLRAALQRAVACMQVLIVRRGIESCCFVDVRFKSGVNRVYVVWHKPVHRAGNGMRDGYWWACSSITRHDMDLRSLEDQQFAADFVANWQEPQDVADVASLHFIRETIPAR